MKRLIYQLSFTTCIASLVLTGCGGGGGSINNGGTVNPPTPSAPAPDTVFGGKPAGWTLAWSDEFDVSGLPDRSKWDYDTSRNALGWYNNELQYYARDRLENTRVESGKLIITARRESLTSAGDYGGQRYTSARLVTQDKID